MDFHAPASVNMDVFTTSMPAMTLTFDLQNITRSPAGTSGYSV